MGSIFSFGNFGTSDKKIEKDNVIVSISPAFHVFSSRWQSHYSMLDLVCCDHAVRLFAASDELNATGHFSGLGLPEEIDVITTVVRNANSAEWLRNSQTRSQFPSVWIPLKIYIQYCVTKQNEK